MCIPGQRSDPNTQFSVGFLSSGSPQKYYPPPIGGQHSSLFLSPRRNGWDTPSVLLAVIVVVAFFFACHFGSFLPSAATLLPRFLPGIGSEHSDLSTLA